MAAHCLKLSTALSFAICFFLCPDDSTTTGMKSMDACNSGPCGFGERFDPTKSACLPCDQGTFLDLNNHRCIQCIPCTQANTLEHELVVRNCTAMNDTEIGCDLFHYRIKLDDFREPFCQKCTHCGKGQRVALHCGPDSDTVCVNDKLESTHNTSGSSAVRDSSSYFEDATSSTLDENTNHIYHHDSTFYKETRSFPFAFVVPVVTLAAAIILLLIVLTLKKKDVCEMSRKSPYRRMTDTQGYDPQGFFKTSTGVFVTTV